MEDAQPIQTSPGWNPPPELPSEGSAPPSSAGDVRPEEGGPESQGSGGGSDPYANVAELDADELVKRHPKLRDTINGLRGRQVTPQTREQIRAELRAEVEAERETERLRELRRTDPYKYAEETEAQEAARQREAEAGRGYEARFVGLVNDFDGLIRQQLGRLPEDVRAKIGTKQYGQDIQARADYLEDVFAEYAEHIRREERAKWNQEDRGAIETEVRGEYALRNPLDTGSGNPPGTRVFTDEDIDRMDLHEYTKYFDERGEPRDGVVYQPPAEAQAAAARRRR